MAQHVTPELRHWVAEQARAGTEAQAVLASLRASGWTTEVALAALGAAWVSPANAAHAAADVPVPEPDLQGAPLHLDAGDRRVAVLGTLQAPRVVLFGEMLSVAECDDLIAAARPRLERSKTVALQTGGREINPDRTSQGMFFTRGESPLVRRIEARIARLLGWPVERGEGLQVLRYVSGTEYRPHHDYFDPDAAGTPALLDAGGQRVATVILYLSEPERGGGTAFPDVGFTVAPRRGHGLFFSYARPHPDTLTLHAGLPVLAGEKWIATKWLREREFD